MAFEHLYLSDLDKTFLRSDLSISDYSLRVWNEAVAAGGRLSVATARSLTGVGGLLKALDMREPMILLDGVMIARMDGEILHLNALDRELGEEIISIARASISSSPLIVGLEEDGKESFVYPERPNIYQQELLSTFHNDRRVIEMGESRAMDRNLKLVFMENEERSAILEDELRATLGDEIEIKRSDDPYIDCWFVTVLHPHGDKAHALQKLEEIEELSAEETTVFGDSHNDIGLFDYAGRKIAVSNAIDELKRRADIVLQRSNDEDAVAHFIAEEMKIGE